jgi:hypothetical protein
VFGGRSFDLGAQRPGAAEDLVDGWLAKIEEQATRRHDLAVRLAALTATAESAAGLVSVTVGATGLVTGLALAEGIRDRPAADTARDILTTLGAAQALLATKAIAVTAEAARRAPQDRPRPGVSDSRHRPTTPARAVTTPSTG